MSDAFEELFDVEGFEWDEANVNKNLERHRVQPFEAEQVFFNSPLVVADDLAHGEGEDRYFALGKTDRGGRLFCAFTVRKNLIRVISVRDMTRKEREVYHEREG